MIEGFTSISDVVRSAEDSLAKSDEVVVPVRIDTAGDLSIFVAHLKLVPDDQLCIGDLLLRERIDSIGNRLKDGFRNGGGVMTLPNFSRSDLDLIIDLAKSPRFRKQKEGTYKGFVRRLESVRKKHQKILEGKTR